MRSPAGFIKRILPRASAMVSPSVMLCTMASSCSASSCSASTPGTASRSTAGSSPASGAAGGAAGGPASGAAGASWAAAWLPSRRPRTSALRMHHAPPVFAADRRPRRQSAFTVFGCSCSSQATCCTVSTAGSASQSVGCGKGAFLITLPGSIGEQPAFAHKTHDIDPAAQAQPGLQGLAHPLGRRRILSKRLADPAHHKALRQQHQ